MEHKHKLSLSIVRGRGYLKGAAKRLYVALWRHANVASFRVFPNSSSRRPFSWRIRYRNFSEGFVRHVLVAVSQLYDCGRTAHVQYIVERKETVKSLELVSNQEDRWRRRWSNLHRIKNESEQGSKNEDRDTKVHLGNKVLAKRIQSTKLAIIAQ